ncbi:MAG: SDR family oxidoreductase, partial [Pirellulales bacterium]
HCSNPVCKESEEFFRDDYLMRDLLLQGNKLAVLIRGAKKANALQRLEAIMQKWESELGTKLPRPICFEGDVCQENLGLSTEDQKWVRENCDSMIHNAAILTFYNADREGDLWKTNVGGIQNVLDFCEELKIENMHYVSTAYVYGKRDDLVYENELNPHLGFRNDYEESKYLSEKLVRAADFFHN